MGLVDCGRCAACNDCQDYLGDIRSCLYTSIVPIAAATCGYVVAVNITQLTTDKHVEDMCMLAQLHHEEFGTSREFDRLAIVSTGLRVIDDAKHEVFNCWIAYKDDAPIGYLYACTTRSPYSWRRHASQIMWFVVKSERGTLVAKRLTTAFERWAVTLNCEIITMSVEHTYDEGMVSRIIRLINALGYKTRGMYAIKHLTSEPNK